MIFFAGLDVVGLVVGQAQGRSLSAVVTNNPTRLLEASYSPEYLVQCVRESPAKGDDFNQPDITIAVSC